MFSILYRILTKNRPRSLADDADIGLAFTYFWVLIPVDGRSCTGLALNFSCTIKCEQETRILVQHSLILLLLCMLLTKSVDISRVDDMNQNKPNTTHPLPHPPPKDLKNIRPLLTLRQCITSGVLLGTTTIHQPAAVALKLVRAFVVN